MLRRKFEKKILYVVIFFELLGLRLFDSVKSSVACSEALDIAESHFVEVIVVLCEWLGASHLILPLSEEHPVSRV